MEDAQAVAMARIKDARRLGDTFLPLEGKTRFGFCDGRDIADWLSESGFSVIRHGTGDGDYGFAVTDCGLVVESTGYVTTHGYTYKRYPDGKGRQVHVVETRCGRFEGQSQQEAMTLALDAERAADLAAERADRLRQIAREEQEMALAFTDSRRA